jgi:hypothetical protein
MFNDDFAQLQQIIKKVEPIHHLYCKLQAIPLFFPSGDFQLRCRHRPLGKSYGQQHRPSQSILICNATSTSDNQCALGPWAPVGHISSGHSPPRMRRGVEMTVTALRVASNSRTPTASMPSLCVAPAKRSEWWKDGLCKHFIKHQVSSRITMHCQSTQCIVSGKEQRKQRTSHGSRLTPLSAFTTTQWHYGKCFFVLTVHVFLCLHSGCFALDGTWFLTRTNSESKRTTYQT